MWQELLALSNDKKSVIATLQTDMTLSSDLKLDDIHQALAELGAAKFFFDEKEVIRFINIAKETKKEAYTGVLVAAQRDAELALELMHDDMVAVMHITGAYGGKGLKGSDIMHALAQNHITKGINKLALKKVMVTSHQLKAGEKFSQPVAKGKDAVQGRDTQFIPLFKDAMKRVLKPQEVDSDTHKVDMRNLGTTVTVNPGDPLVKRIPPTEGESGYTVTGEEVAAVSGKDSALVAGKGAIISKKNPNVLLAEIGGMPKIKPNGAMVDNSLHLNSVDATSGHVKFKGDIVVSGNVEPGMIVQATGSITVGGFIESANVQAQGDIKVGKGIIGHNVSEEEEKSCKVISGGSVTANYAQFCQVQASKNILLSVHCMNSDIRCNGDLIVLDASEKQGTLSGGEAIIGGKVVCVNLGVEGDTMTRVTAFAHYERYKNKIAELKGVYSDCQTVTMDVIRKELELKKTPKSERDPAAEDKIEQEKTHNAARLEQAKARLNTIEDEFQHHLDTSVVEAKEKVYTRVNVHYGDEQVLTKRVHGATVFSFNQYQIEVKSLLDIEEDADI